MVTAYASSVTYRISSLSPYSWREGGVVNSLSFSFKLFFFGTFFFSLFSFFSYQTQTHFRNRHTPKTTSNFRMPYMPHISHTTSAAYYTQQALPDLLSVILYYWYQVLYTIILFSDTSIFKYSKAIYLYKALNCSYRWVCIAMDKLYLKRCFFALWSI